MELTVIEFKSEMKNIFLPKFDNNVIELERLYNNKPLTDGEQRAIRIDVYEFSGDSFRKPPMSMKPLESHL